MILMYIKDHFGVHYSFESTLIQAMNNPRSTSSQFDDYPYCYGYLTVGTWQ